ncbi:hypothetical protein [Lacrimispora indolis]|uniref:hypothetical protein n=1 Tax=Lacrimispora indolis TaxID=69825 RepID=UPI00045E7B4C|nr:hypothetical protein [Lacrimispora indolis]
MYCVIQEIEKKTVPVGEPKEIEVRKTNWTMNGESYTSYGYQYSQECYERQIRKAYRISIHKSFREGGRVCKKQTVICTIGYYDLIDCSSWIGDYISGSRWSDKVKEIGLPEEELVSMIYEKFQPIVDLVEAEFHQTEEYKAKEEHRRILKEYQQRVDEFIKKYEATERDYKCCYDVFGNLMNSDSLKRIEENYKQRREYERRSQEQSRSYYENFYNNYTGSSSNSYGSAGGQQNEASKATLKQFYRTLSKVYHPDSNPGKDTSEEMKVLNQLKTEWGV